MSFEDFKRIIANLRSCFDVRIVSLHRDGEPLLNKRLEAYIAHSDRAGHLRYRVVELFPSSRKNAPTRLIEAGLRHGGYRLLR